MSKITPNFEDLHIMTSIFQPETLSQNIKSYTFPEVQSKSHEINEPYNLYRPVSIDFLKETQDFHPLLDSEIAIKILNKKNTNLLHKTLDNLHKECEEEDYEVFNELARINAKKVLDFLCKNFPEYDYDIYPTNEREIDIYCSPCKGHGILILCDSEGSVAYFKTSDGRNNRYRCQNINDFPFDQLYKEFKSFNPTKEESNIKFLEVLSSDEYRCA